MDLKCKDCGNEASYSDEYDALYCESCNIWCEDKCGDADCDFCNIRPELPNLVNDS